MNEIKYFDIEVTSHDDHARSGGVERHAERSGPVREKNPNEATEDRPKSCSLVGLRLSVVFGVRREKARVFSGCDSRPASQSLQPVAIGAAVEVTKPPKPSMQRVASGDPASRQAVTRVNAEQASKRAMWEPTRHRNGEGRRHWGTGG